jgi:hypothetical protein
MQKVDFKKEFSELYKQPRGEVSVVEVPEFNFLKIDGVGDPNTATEFSEAVETLYPLAYEIRAIVKETQDVQFVVMPLEGLWWADDMDAFTGGKKDDWQWTVMIMQPEPVSEAILERAREQVAEKKAPPRLADVRFESYDEGLAAQVLHVGPYTEEGPTIERLHEFIASQGYTRRGHHHEIYLSDARRTDPEKLKTILRQPIEE